MWGASREILVPDTFLHRADEVVNVDVTVEELRSRLRQGKVYKAEQVEQALTNFFREGNLSTLRELALRAGWQRAWAPPWFASKPIVQPTA